MTVYSNSASLMNKLKVKLSRSRNPDHEKKEDNLRRMSHFLAISAVFMFAYVVFTAAIAIGLITGYHAVLYTSLFGGLSLSLIFGGFARAMTFPKRIVEE